MKQIHTLLTLLFLLNACAPIPTGIQTTTAVISPSETPSLPGVTDLPASAPSPPTSTPAPCDPSTVDFCIAGGHFIYQRPIHAPANDSVERTYPFASTADGAREPHHGVEFINATGTPVFAAADGTILFAGPDEEAVYNPWKRFYGNVIVIRHANHLFTLYAHLSQIDVKAGGQVKAGDKIGEVGKTGGAIGSHLHFEVRRGDVKDYFSALNPELWLDLREGEGALTIRVENVEGEFRQAEITIQSDDQAYFIGTYEEEFLFMEENAVLGELTPGRYRITFYSGGQFYERWVEVQAGRLTQVAFIVK